MELGKRRCQRCGRECPISEMRYATPERLVCRSCLDKGRPASAKTVHLEGTEYRCSACKYVFRRRKPVSVCPYCGKDTVTARISAQHILDGDENEDG